MISNATEAKEDGFLMGPQPSRKLIRLRCWAQPSIVSVRELINHTRGDLPRIDFQMMAALGSFPDHYYSAVAILSGILPPLLFFVSILESNENRNRGESHIDG